MGARREVSQRAVKRLERTPAWARGPAGGMPRHPRWSATAGMSTPTTTTHYRKGTYQMLWDCPQCGREKNLGVDHRHCPGCGQVQEANMRYMPGPGERIPTAFNGRSPDITCAHCQTPNASADNNCINCGAPLAESKPVHVRPSIPEHAAETGADAQQDWDARKADERRQQIAHHQPEAQHARESARATAYTAARTLRDAPQQTHADDPVDLRSLGITRGLGWPAAHWAIAGGVALVIALVMLVLLWKKDVKVEVQGHTWERKIAVERYASVADDDWCSSMPSDAYDVSRRSEVHHTDQIPDGETCRTEAGSCTDSCRNVDNGNGSFSTDCTRTCTPDRQVCSTKYRSEPVYRDKCYYSVDRWRHQRDATAKGSAVKPAPAWPNPEFKDCSVRRLGCERLGSRSQTYTVHFAAPTESEAFECEYDERTWAGYAIGSTWDARVGVLWARLDCGSLNPG